MKNNDTSAIKNYTFISYDRQDEKWASWLQAKLNHFKIPTSLRENGELYIKPIFKAKKDDHPDDLHLQELESSRFLIVIASKAAAQPDGIVDNQVRHFKQSDRQRQIIPFIVNGTPQPKNNTEHQCYPPALDKEILGASVADTGKEEAFLKVVAHLLHISFDSLWKRQQRKKRRKIFLSAALIAVLLVLGFIGYNRYAKKEFIDAVRNDKIPFLKTGLDNANGNPDSVTALILREENFTYLPDIKKYYSHLDTLVVGNLDYLDLSCLSSFKSIKCLGLTMIDSLPTLSGIGQFVHLQELEIKEIDNLNSLAGIEKLPNLKSLSIDYYNPIDLSSINQTKSLENLVFAGNKPLDVANFKDLQHLKTLTISENMPIDSNLLRSQHPGVELIIDD